MVRAKQGVYAPREKKVLVLWDLDNKPPRCSPYRAADSLKRVAGNSGIPERFLPMRIGTPSCTCRGGWLRRGKRGGAGHPGEERYRVPCSTGLVCCSNKRASFKSAWTKKLVVGDS
ncbi:hypothetical protein MLD38_022320 [Melastoma candidum]|uniref:Uncharacterized protein n=1 Tax=Melastoma candidum TaxID=119954 RepID=A0ACB9QLW3_9MYRT|nr:hypothetical protein MLD38_022320 [Melastoma candidum]